MWCCVGRRASGEVLLGSHHINVPDDGGGGMIAENAGFRYRLNAFLEKRCVQNTLMALLCLEMVIVFLDLVTELPVVKQSGDWIRVAEKVIKGVGIVILGSILLESLLIMVVSPCTWSSKVLFVLINFVVALVSLMLDITTLIFPDPSLELGLGSVVLQWVVVQFVNGMMKVVSEDLREELKEQKQLISSLESLVKGLEKQLSSEQNPNRVSAEPTPTTSQL